ncbi:MAG: polysaccharide deacetylase family protein [Phycisphaerales bacterium]|nr:polysaccharide deacetylase family protein [Phycisphaerales bacterium]
MISSAIGAGFATQYMGPYVLKRLSIWRLSRTCRSTRSLVLTYDDGPSERVTVPLLATLKSARARASFFPTGRSGVPRAPLLEALRRDGHEIGCHSMDHLHAWRCGPFAAMRDVSQGFAALDPWLSRPLLFRPPHGKLTALSWAASRPARLAWWTHDSGDTAPVVPPLQPLLDRVAGAGGAVVLFHDFERTGADREKRHGFVLDATEHLLRLAEREALHVAGFGSIGGLS